MPRGIYVVEEEEEEEEYSRSQKLQKMEKPQFKINKGTPITDLNSLINAFNHPKADEQQKELINHLRELNEMIGMQGFKECVINQILFFVQDLKTPETYLHTVITGKPGTGKTRAIGTLAKIYSKLGILQGDKVIRADRSNLIGNWLGATSIKTKQVLESAKGGILVIDEVYSLGSKEHLDTYSKECIDTINQYLSEHVDEFICIIAGYKDLVKECFFDANPGLERRFPWKFTIDSYDSGELTEIMKMQIESSGWKMELGVSDLEKLIRKNKQYFTGNGGDTKNLIDKCKIIAARRLFTSNKLLKVLTKGDIEEGFKSFVAFKDIL